MELESLHKYLSILQINPNLTEVLFSGQPCMNVSKIEDDTYMWAPNPVFAKLTYGANVFSDLPRGDVKDTLEEAIADGLVKFEELGSFNTLVDLPGDTNAVYESVQIADTIKLVYRDCIVEAVKRASSAIEANTMTEQLLSEMVTLPGHSSASEPSTSVVDIDESKKDDRKEILAAVKKNRKFASKYGAAGMYAVDSDISGAAK